MTRVTIGDVVITLAALAALAVLVVLAVLSAIVVPLLGAVAVVVALVRAARAGWCVCRRSIEPTRAPVPVADPIPDYVGFDAPRLRRPVECVAWHVPGTTQAEIAHRALMEVLA